MSQNLIGVIRLDEALNHLLAAAQLGGDIFTLDSLAVMWGISREFRRLCPVPVRAEVGVIEPGKVLEVVR